jgi:hypothetical protein
MYEAALDLDPLTSASGDALDGRSHSRLEVEALGRAKVEFTGVPTLAQGSVFLKFALCMERLIDGHPRVELTRLG